MSVLSRQQRQPTATVTEPAEPAAESAAGPAHQEAALLGQRQQHHQRDQPLQRGLQHGRRRQEQEEEQKELGKTSNFGVETFKCAGGPNSWSVCFSCLCLFRAFLSVRWHHVFGGFSLLRRLLLGKR